MTEEDIRSWFKEKISPYIETEESSLFHYTTAEGLLGIINNKEFWVSERDFMNDMNEKVHPKKYLDNYVIDSAELRLPNFYVASFSTKGDMSNQWASYGKSGGYCIQFEKDDLLSFFDNCTNVKKIYHGKVIYGEKKKKRIASMFNKLLREKHIENHSTLYEYYSLLNLLFKESNSSYEDEYRFCFVSGKVNFRSRGALITPFIKLYTDDDSSERKNIPLNKIIVGPNIHDSKAVESIEYFLRCNHYLVNHDGVVRSKSKVRNI